ncbi:MAG: cytochrome C [Candidatus Lambdaproteobacteria bacterium]|nr:cytochrome C [Candidatus Lambdaproteobacteria bacterium]
MTLIRCVAFGVAVLSAFTLFSNILPQVRTNPPQDGAPPAAPSADGAGMVAWGQALFSGKGSCNLCHNPLGRAPDLLALDLAKVLPQRLADSRYAGKARGLAGPVAIEAYLRESMLAPSAYVVAGFGRRGSNDALSPMPRIDAPPISLSADEIDAVVAFLQDRAGIPVTVRLPAKAERTAGGNTAQAAAAPESPPAETAQAALQKFLCPACHDLAGSGATIGPKLETAGKRLGRAGLREAILEPNARVAPGYVANVMPQDFARRMRVSELELILDHVLGLAEPVRPP